MEKVLASVRRGNIPRPPLVSCILVSLLIIIWSEFYSVHKQVTLMEGTLSERESQQGTIHKATTTAKTNNGKQRKHVATNPHPFSFSMNHPKKCQNEDVFLLIFVTTPPQNHEQRQAIRETWGNESNVPGVVIKTIFAVGVSDDIATQQALEDENKAYGDVIQENFADTHRSMAIKTIMCLKWAVHFCPNAKFVMKTEPETFVNTFSLVRYLKELYATKKPSKLLLGWVNNDTQPVRDPDSEWSQWYVGTDEFPRDTYPNHAAGFAYVMSSDMPRLLYETSLTIKYLFIEDVYIGLCLEKLGIVPRHHSGFCAWYVEIDSCYFDWLMVSRFIDSPEKIVRFWTAITSDYC